MFRFFDSCKVLIAVLCLLSIQLPAYLTIQRWSSIPTASTGFDIKIWILLSTVALDIMFIQAVFFNKTLTTVKTLPKIISMMATLPVFAILTYSSAVLNDADNYSEYQKLLWLQSTARNVQIFEKLYGLYLVIYVATCLLTPFSSFFQLKLFHRLYIFISYGLVFGIGLMPIFLKAQNVPTWWLILSTLSVVIYIVTFITNFVYTASNIKIMGISILLGLIPNLFLSIKGIFLVVPSTQFTEPLVRYSMLTILNLIWWDHYSKPLSHCSPCCDVHFITLLRSSENSTTRIDS